MKIVQFLGSDPLEKGEKSKFDENLIWLVRFFTLFGGNQGKMLRKSRSVLRERRKSSEIK